MADTGGIPLFLMILWRLIVVTTGFCVAIVAAGLVLAWAIGHDLANSVFLGPQPILLSHLIRSVALAAAFAGISFVPWVIGTIIAELLQFRSIYYHLGLGALCGAAATIFHPIGDNRSFQVAVAAGLDAGGVYWLIAGRRAGNWWPRHVPTLRQAMPPPPPPPAP